MTRHRESISVASLPPKEHAMKNTWMGSGSISAENVSWKKVVFVRFRLSDDQLRTSADQINDFGVVNFADSETWVFQRLKYSHMCRL
ncbi:hypothetical protein MTR_8g432410 [Medicago truncatula]|uniref:Uncharacterized protein n=1 Tax=Medicago truncatula TaxID=3880 RepID=A0A072TQ38_MEDTR|nr:hypothetical protein MTR_8g432410 [Medicago truncatula]